MTFLQEILSYFSITIIITCIIYLLGFGSNKIFISTRVGSLQSFLSFLTGITLLIIFYSVFSTNGNTVNIGFSILFLFFLAYLNITKGRISLIDKGHQETNYSFQFLEIFFVVSLIFFLQLYSVIDLDNGVFLLSSNPDRVLFSDVINFINLSGVETYKINFTELSSLKPSPYHYFELWFSGILHKLFDLKVYLLDHLVSSSIFGVIIYLGAKSVAQYYNVSYFFSSLLAIVLSVLNFEMQFQLLEGVDLLRRNNIYFQLSAIEYAKFFPIYLFLLSFLIFYLYRHYFLSLLSLLALPLVNILLLPSTLVTSLAFLGYSWKKKLLNNREVILSLISIFGLAIFLFCFYFLFNSKTEGSNEQNFLTQIQSIFEYLLSITSINIFIGSIIQIIYALFPFLLLIVFLFYSNKAYFNKNKPFVFVSILFLFFSITGLISWIIYSFHPESHQFFTRHTHVLINLIALIILSISYKTNKIISWLFLSLVLIMKTNYLIVDLKDFRELSLNSYSQKFITDIQKGLQEQDLNGAFIVDPEKLLSVRAKAITKRIGNLTLLTDLERTPINLSDFSNTLSTDALLKSIEESSISDLPFYKFLKSQKQKEIFIDIETSQIDYIAKNKISYLIMGEGVQVSNALKKIVVKSYFDNVSKESLHILDYNLLKY